MPEGRRSGEGAPVYAPSPVVHGPAPHESPGNSTAFPIPIDIR